MIYLLFQITFINDTFYRYIQINYLFNAPKNNSRLFIYFFFYIINLFHTYTRTIGKSILIHISEKKTNLMFISISFYFHSDTYEFNLLIIFVINLNIFLVRLNVCLNIIRIIQFYFSNEWYNSIFKKKYILRFFWSWWTWLFKCS